MLTFLKTYMSKRKEKSDRGDWEENVYSEQSREDLIDSDEISPEEEGFMAGYDEADESEDDDDEEDSEEEDSDII